jgi:hypothetical protein
MYPGLAMGAMNTLILHASEEQKQTYLTKLASGDWLGTMCLTEPHCGTDLGQVRHASPPRPRALGLVSRIGFMAGGGLGPHCRQVKTKAVKQADGTYRVSGTKIFISCGEHDFTDNIVHIVLARCEGAPAGTKGISLFIVPKYLVKAVGSMDKSRRNVTCGGIEHKMGIHGSSTCVMNFDDSTAYLIGQENRGLHQMFTFMNVRTDRCRGRQWMARKGLPSSRPLSPTLLPLLLFSHGGGPCRRRASAQRCKVRARSRTLCRVAGQPTCRGACAGLGAAELAYQGAFAYANINYVLVGAAISAPQRL